MIRLLLPLPDPAPSEVRVEAEKLHYLARVLRASVGDQLEVFDGKGRAFVARVSVIGPADATLVLERERPALVGSPLAILQGLPKAEKMEWILQKSTELGATAFYPATTARSVVQLEGKRAIDRAERWQRIVGEASRQCGRSDVPTVCPIAPLMDQVRALSRTRLIVLDEEERACSFAEALPERIEPLAIAIGPEGGFAREEIAAMRAAGAVTATLGSTVLRTETASLAALAIALHRFGRLG